MRRRFFWMAFFLCAPFGVAAQTDVGPETGLPLPRFVTTGSDQVNVRTGPGARYPIAWQFQRRHWPVEVTAEFEHWLKIRDPDGAEGWVRRNLMSGARYALVRSEVKRAALRREAQSQAPLLAELEPGVLVEILSCEGAWCRVEVRQADLRRRGHMERALLWGVYPNEDIQ